MSNGNGHKPTPDRPWGRIDQVFIEEIPPSARAVRKSKWEPLYLDVVQYLKEAPDTCALKVPFADRKAATAACNALYKRAKKELNTDRAITITQRDNVLYIQRGPDWPRKADSKRTAREHDAVDYD